MTYQHQILPVNPRLDVRVDPELRGYFTLSYRVVDPRYTHDYQWRLIEHLTADELADVHAAVLDGYVEDYDAQGLF